MGLFLWPSSTNYFVPRTPQGEESLRPPRITRPRYRDGPNISHDRSSPLPITTQTLFFTPNPTAGLTREPVTSSTRIPRTGRDGRPTSAMAAIAHTTLFLYNCRCCSVHVPRGDNQASTRNGRKKQLLEAPPCRRPLEHASSKCMDQGAEGPSVTTVILAITILGCCFHDIYWPFRTRCSVPLDELRCRAVTTNSRKKS